MTICPHCGEETLFVKEPVFEGLRKAGEVKKCTSCGRRVADTKPPVSGGGSSDPLAAFFGDEVDREDLHLFDVEAETAQLCRKCRHYVIHPFTQRCGLHDREVAATDSCPEFEIPGG